MNIYSVQEIKKIKDKIMLIFNSGLSIPIDNNDFLIAVKKIFHKNDLAYLSEKAITNDFLLNNINDILLCLNNYYCLIKDENLSIFYQKKNILYKDYCKVRDIFDLYVDNKKVGEAEIETKDSNMNWHIKIKKEYQKKGYGNKFYDMADFYCKKQGLKFVPSSILSDIAYNMWKKREPKLLKYHTHNGDDGYHIRQDRIADKLKEKLENMIDLFVNELPNNMKPEDKNDIFIDFVYNINDERLQYYFDFYIKRVLGRLLDYDDFEKANLKIKNNTLYTDQNIIDFLQNDIYFLYSLGIIGMKKYFNYYSDNILSFR